MKKLMIAALATTAVGGAFAAGGFPLVYDYKASVKHVYLKEVKVGATLVYQKYQKSATLKGYLIMDDEGATSASYADGASYFGLADNSGTYTADQGRNRGFLVVQNGSVESKVKHPKILPAVMDGRWLDTNFKKAHKATTGLAEGTLFVGGDNFIATREKLELNNTGVHTINGTALTAPAANVPGLSAISDYVWTSIYLFGQFNGPNWYQTAGASPFDAFEKAWDNNLPTGIQTWNNATTPKTVINYYHDTWMNGAGVGKFGTPDPVGELCCGLTKVNQNRIITQLSGSLKGGIFLCTENGIGVNSAYYDWFDSTPAVFNGAWEDQFACCRDDPREVLTYLGATFVAAGDKWQNDLWQDGPFEQETTDVVYGTWSIKYNNSFLSKVAVELTPAQILAINPVVGTEALWASIKGAALKLNPKATLWDGTEIYNKTSAQRFSVPLITPSFAKYYSLAQ
jgi:hypothetical protein